MCAALTQQALEYLSILLLSEKQKYLIIPHIASEMTKLLEASLKFDSKYSTLHIAWLLK